MDRYPPIFSHTRATMSRDITKLLGQKWEGIMEEADEILALDVTYRNKEYTFVGEWNDIVQLRSLVCAQLEVLDYSSEQGQQRMTQSVYEFHSPSVSDGRARHPSDDSASLPYMARQGHPRSVRSDTHRRHSPMTYQGQSPMRAEHRQQNSRSSSIRSSKLLQQMPSSVPSCNSRQLTADSVPRDSSPRPAAGDSSSQGTLDDSKQSHKLVDDENASKASSDHVSRILETATQHGNTKESGSKTSLESKVLAGLQAAGQRDSLESPFENDEFFSVSDGNVENDVNFKFDEMDNRGEHGDGNRVEDSFQEKKIELIPTGETEKDNSGNRSYANGFNPVPVEINTNKEPESSSRKQDQPGSSSEQQTDASERELENLSTNRSVNEADRPLVLNTTSTTAPDIIGAHVSEKIGRYERGYRTYVTETDLERNSRNRRPSNSSMPSLVPVSIVGNQEDEDREGESSVGDQAGGYQLMEDDDNCPQEFSVDGQDVTATTNQHVFDREVSVGDLNLSEKFDDSWSLNDPEGGNKLEQKKDIWSKVSVEEDEEGDSADDEEDLLRAGTFSSEYVEIQLEKDKKQNKSSDQASTNSSSTGSSSDVFVIEDVVPSQLHRNEVQDEVSITKGESQQTTFETEGVNSQLKNANGEDDDGDEDDDDDDDDDSRKTFTITGRDNANFENVLDDEDDDDDRIVSPNNEDVKSSIDRLDKEYITVKRSRTDGALSKEKQDSVVKETKNDKDEASVLAAEQYRAKKMEIQHFMDQHNPEDDIDERQIHSDQNNQPDSEDDIDERQRLIDQHNQPDSEDVIDERQIHSDQNNQPDSEDGINERQRLIDQHNQPDSEDGIDERQIHSGQNNQPDSEDDIDERQRHSDQNNQPESEDAIDDRQRHSDQNNQPESEDAIDDRQRLIDDIFYSDNMQIQSEEQHVSETAMEVEHHKVDSDMDFEKSNNIELEKENIDDIDEFHLNENATDDDPELPVTVKTDRALISHPDGSFDVFEGEKAKPDQVRMSKQQAKPIDIELYMDSKQMQYMLLYYKNDIKMAEQRFGVKFRAMDCDGDEISQFRIIADCPRPNMKMAEDLITRLQADIQEDCVETPVKLGSGVTEELCNEGIDKIREVYINVYIQRVMLDGKRIVLFVGKNDLAYEASTAFKETVKMIPPRAMPQELRKPPRQRKRWSNENHAASDRARVVVKKEEAVKPVEKVCKFKMSEIPSLFESDDDDWHVGTDYSREKKQRDKVARAAGLPQTNSHALTENNSAHSSVINKEVVQLTASDSDQEPQGNGQKYAKSPPNPQSVYEPKTPASSAHIASKLSVNSLGDSDDDFGSDTKADLTKPHDYPNYKSNKNIDSSDEELSADIKKLPEPKSSPTGRLCNTNDREVMNQRTTKTSSHTQNMASDDNSDDDHSPVKTHKKQTKSYKPAHQKQIFSESEDEDSLSNTIEKVQAQTVSSHHPLFDKNPDDEKLLGTPKEKSSLSSTNHASASLDDLYSDEDPPAAKQQSSARPPFSSYKLEHEVEQIRLSKEQSPVLQLLYELIDNHDPGTEIERLINEILSGKSVGDARGGMFSSDTFQQDFDRLNSARVDDDSMEGFTMNVGKHGRNGSNHQMVHSQSVATSHGLVKHNSDTHKVTGQLSNNREGKVEPQSRSNKPLEKDTTSRVYSDQTPGSTGLRNLQSSDHGEDSEDEIISRAFKADNPPRGRSNYIDTEHPEPKTKEEPCSLTSDMIEHAKELSQNLTVNNHIRNSDDSGKNTVRNDTEEWSLAKSPTEDDIIKHVKIKSLSDRNVDVGYQRRIPPLHSRENGDGDADTDDGIDEHVKKVSRDDNVHGRSPLSGRIQNDGGHVKKGNRSRSQSPSEDDIIEHVKKVSREENVNNRSPLSGRIQNDGGRVRKEHRSRSQSPSEDDIIEHVKSQSLDNKRIPGKRTDFGNVNPSMSQSAHVPSNAHREHEMIELAKRLSLDDNKHTSLDNTVNGDHFRDHEISEQEMLDHVKKLSLKESNPKSKTDIDSRQEKESQSQYMNNRHANDDELPPRRRNGNQPPPTGSRDAGNYHNHRDRNSTPSPTEELMEQVRRMSMSDYQHRPETTGKKPTPNVMTSSFMGEEPASMTASYGPGCGNLFSDEDLVVKLPIKRHGYQPPNGTMHLMIDKKYHLAGFPSQGAKLITFKFDPGKEANGPKYNGAQEELLIPNGPEAKAVYRDLKKAFDSKKLFTLEKVEGSYCVTPRLPFKKKKTEYPDPSYLPSLKHALNTML